MLLDRILTQIPSGTAIPKPSAKRQFTFRGEGKVRDERGVIYSIPNHKNPDKPGQKGIAVSQLRRAFDQLRTGQLTRAWWNKNVRHNANEGGCNFTTVGGIFVLLKEAKYVRPGVYEWRNGSNCR
jgi:hypothetical protein